MDCIPDLLEDSAPSVVRMGWRLVQAQDRRHATIRSFQFLAQGIARARPEDCRQPLA